jgi:hypothetical protein
MLASCAADAATLRSLAGPRGEIPEQPWRLGGRTATAANNSQIRRWVVDFSAVLRRVGLLSLIVR